MDDSEKVLESSYGYKLDPKFRVSVPVSFRPETEGEPLRLLRSKEYGMPVIKVTSIEVFEDKFRQIEASNWTAAKKKQFVGALRMNSRKATLSSQGKLTIPKEWAEQAGLAAEKSVQLGGRGDYFIVCSDQTLNRINEVEFNLDQDDLGVL